MKRFLVDTHILLWSLIVPEKLQPHERSAIRASEHRIFASAASAWEMAIKASLGKLDMPDDLESQLTRMRFELLPVTVAHALQVRRLPPLHRDPFDRMLVAQAQLEGLVLITRDEALRAYQVDCLQRSL